MQHLKTAAVLALALGMAAMMQASLAQSPSPQSPPSAPPTAAAPSQPPAIPLPALTAKDLEGLDVFGSEGQQLGKVTKVNMSTDGKVKDVEVQTQGFLGFFRTTYVVPVEKLSKKAGRIDLSMTTEQAKVLAR
jgi:sporulation protein YlmC with PRC-barrel domain